MITLYSCLVIATNVDVSALAVTVFQQLAADLIVLNTVVVVELLNSSRHRTLAAPFAANRILLT